MSEENTNPSASTEQVVPEQVASTEPEQTSTPVEPAQTEGSAEVQEESFFDPKGLAPELQPAYKQMQAAFTKKTQGIADFHKKAEALDQLVSYAPFVEWYNKQNNPEQPKKDSGSQEPVEPDMSDDQFSNLVQNKDEFNKYVKGLAKKQAEEMYLPMAQKTQREVDYLKNLEKIKSFGQEHPDFWDLDKKGLVEPLIRKYPQMDLDDIYKLAKYSTVESEAVKKAHNMVQAKKEAVVEQPGANVPASRKVKVKNRREAMMQAYEAAEKGQTPPEFEF